MTDEMLSYRQAAKFLGVPIGTLYAMVCRHRLAHVRLGPRLVRFSRSKLEELVHENTINADVSNRSTEKEVSRESDRKRRKR
jgi:excisionase family DNA binding protein